MNEKKYLDIFINPILKCQDYKPKFGNSRNEKGFSLNDFIELYSSDPFYSWIGLDSELIYAAHKAAGGMTSIYRQIGVGCENLFRQIVLDKAEYADPSMASWSYTSFTKSGEKKVLSLDARLELTEIQNKRVLSNITTWIGSYCSKLNEVQPPSKGIVFEVRQGYKSKDSKRQNADIDNATVAWANGYMPVFAIFSAQIDYDIVLRYNNNRCGILTGIASDDSSKSLFAFSSQILEYDLADFFKMNSPTIKAEIHKVLEILLSAAK